MVLDNPYIIFNRLNVFSQKAVHRPKNTHIHTHTHVVLQQRHSSPYLESKTNLYYLYLNIKSVYYGM